MARVTIRQGEIAFWIDVEYVVDSRDVPLLDDEMGGENDVLLRNVLRHACPGRGLQAGQWTTLKERNLYLQWGCARILDVSREFHIDRRAPFLFQNPKYFGEVFREIGTA